MKNMSRIQQLDEQIANMIAAGEVVERPMGVVKELVENAIDAGASRIVVSMVNGGMDQVRVEDNGCGMDAVDARMAFQRHATSKIRRQNDLWNIHTLGFRGEALPSIASVSKMTLLTSDGDDAVKVVMEYGEEKVYEPSACPTGTTITVSGLFYRTPARLKHLRSASYEGGKIQDVIQSFALSHPEIAFRLFSNDTEVFRTTGNDNLLEVIYQVYGRAPAEAAIPVSFKDYDYRVNGYIVKPVFTRANRSFIHVFLNGRMVRDNKLYRAVQDGYASMIPQGRYPMCVLQIEMDPHILDVNVHPGKWEVRLSKERQLEYLIAENIIQTLQHTSQTVEVKPQVIKETYCKPMSFTTEELMPKVEEQLPIDEQPATVLTQYEEIQQDNTILHKYVMEEPVKPKVEEKVERVPFPKAVCMGMVCGSYIAASCEMGLLLIDARAAMQRVMYEEALAQMKDTRIKRQLLVPITISCCASVMSRIGDLNETVQDLGVVYEPFGSDTLLVREVPSWLQTDEEKVLQDIVDEFREDHHIRCEALAYKRLVAQVYANMYTYKNDMSVGEMQSLVDRLSQCEDPWTSLQKKPITAMLDARALEKEFK